MERPTLGGLVSALFWIAKVVFLFAIALAGLGSILPPPEHDPDRLLPPGQRCGRAGCRCELFPTP